MAFFISDRFHDSYEVMSLGGPVKHGAVALWAFSGSWSSCHLTGGVLPAALPAHFEMQPYAPELVRVGLWEEHPKGYQFSGAQAAYDRAIRSNRRPTPYVTLGLCRLPSKAFVDWHQSRGLKPGRQSIDEVVRRHVISKHGMTCWLCERAINSTSDLHLDHVIPHSHGGSDEPQNLRPAHASCNIARGVREPEVFRAELLRKGVLQ